MSLKNTQMVDNITWFTTIRGLIDITFYEQKVHKRHAKFNEKSLTAAVKKLTVEII